MGFCVTELYPKVVATHSRQTVYVRLEGDVVAPEVRLHPMEIYGVSHHPDYWSHHGDRYPWIALTDCGGGLWCAELDFAEEQRYCVKFRVGEEVTWSYYLYAVDADLAALRPYKGDTHLHTCRSDGKGEPFDVACAYRAAGYDFIAVTDHGRYAPSEEARREVSALTDRFYIMHGEEVHPKGGSYFHIVSLNADRHVTETFEQRGDFANAEIERILSERDLSMFPDPHAAAIRLFIVDEIHRAGGFAILAHPFWETDGEYNYPTEECRHHLRQSHFDALELFGGNDDTGNGNNLLELVYHDLRVEGCRIPIVGSSDAHTTVIYGDYDHFSKQFSLILAADYDDLLTAITDGRSVAVRRESDKHFRCVGEYRYAKYARFLMAEYYPYYTTLCAAHAQALGEKDAEAITAAETAITAYQERFYSV